MNSQMSLCSTSEFGLDVFMQYTLIFEDMIVPAFLKESNFLRVKAYVPFVSSVVWLFD